MEQPPYFKWQCPSHTKRNVQDSDSVRVENVILPSSLIDPFKIQEMPRSSFLAPKNVDRSIGAKLSAIPRSEESPSNLLSIWKERSCFQTGPEHQKFQIENASFKLRSRKSGLGWMDGRTNGLWMDTHFPSVLSSPFFPFWNLELVGRLVENYAGVNLATNQHTST